MINKPYLLLLISLPAFAAPTWTTEVPQKLGTSLHVSCHGDGPDRSTAFQSALNECRSIATSLIAKDFNVRTLSVQTEKNSALHEEVENIASIKGLECKIEQSLEEANSRWLKCAFDLSKVKSTTAQTDSPAPSIVSENKRIILSIVPNCDSMIVIGSDGRTLPCQKSPNAIMLKPGDSELIVRAEGYQPMHLKTSTIEESSVIYLQKN